MRTYTATAPDGSTHTRKSHRTYTHAVLVTDSVEHVRRRLAEAIHRHQINPAAYPTDPEAEGYYADSIRRAEAQTWGPIGFCGSLELAEKLYNRSRPHDCWDQMIIVKVEES